MKPRKEGETDAHYISRLESQNATLKQNYDGQKKWMAALNEAVTLLSTEASLAFQAMAEKAGVRSHPSVTATVELFDSISHPQWRGEKKIPKIDFPRFWDLDGPRAWAGDADMQLNSPVAAAIEFLDHLKFSGQSGKWEIINEIKEGLHKVIRDGVEGVKDRHGFKPMRVTVPAGFYKEMDAEALRELLNTLGWMALDLAQDMQFANECLRRDLRAAVYRRVAADLYRLSWMDIDPKEETGIDIKVLGGEPAPF
jgi:hypothetical protein